MIRLQVQKRTSLVVIAIVGLATFGGLVARPSARATTTTFTFGGSSDDSVLAIAVDASYNIYLAGTTRSRDLPGTQQAYQRQLRGVGDAFVAKFDSNGRLQWTTYLGGNDSTADQFGTSGEQATAVGVDPQGNVYIAGLTTSADFPTVNAYQAARLSVGVSTDGFLAKLDPSGGRLIYSTYLGGVGGSSRVESLSVGPASEVWVGLNAAPQFPVTRDLSPATPGRAVVALFQSSGAPVWLTRVGTGPFAAELGRMVIDPFGQPTLTIGNDVVQLDASGSHVNFTWSLPNAFPRNIAAGADGTIAVVGTATEIAVKNAWQPERDPAGNGFLALLGPRGVADLVTYLPGATNGAFVAVDPSGGVHLAFDSASPTLSPMGGAAPPHSGAPVFVSLDRGDSWTWASRGLYGGVAAMAIDAARDYVYALAPAGVFRSADRGGSWSLWSMIPRLSPPLTRGEIALDPRDSTTMYVGVNDLWRIDQDGRTSTLLRNAGAGVAGFRVESLAVSPYDGSVWVGSGNGLEVSFDRGRTWAHRDRGFATFSDRVASTERIVFDTRRPGTVYAQAEFGGGIYRSVDYGLDWQRIPTPTLPGGIETFDLDPALPDRIYVGTNLYGIIVSDDGGRSWSGLLPIGLDVARQAPFIAISALAVSPIPPFPVYAVIRYTLRSQAGIITSSDRGATWFDSRHADQRTLPARLVAHPRDRDVVFSAASGVAANPFVMRMDRRSGTSVYTQSFASVFPQGSVRAVATTLDGQTVVALSGPDITMAKVGR